MSGKKKLTPQIWEKSSYLKKKPPPPQKSHGQPHTSKFHPSTKWLARVHHVVVFQTKVLYFKIENKPIIDTNGKRKFKRMLSLLFVDKRELFAMKLSFEEFNLVFFTVDQSAWLVLNQTKAARFLKKLEVHSVYSMVKESTFLKGNFVFIKVSWTFSTFLHRRERKPQNVHLKLIFCHVFSDITCVNGSTIQLVLRELLFKINLWVFE